MFIANDDFRNDQLNDYLAGLDEAENETETDEDDESENLRQRNNRVRSYKRDQVYSNVH